MAGCVLDYNAPFVRVYPRLREFVSDLCGLKQGCGIIWELFALRVTNARSIFKVKEVFHRPSLPVRSNVAHDIGNQPRAFPYLNSSQ